MQYFERCCSLNNDRMLRALLVDFFAILLDARAVQGDV